MKRDGSIDMYFTLPMGMPIDSADADLPIWAYLALPLSSLLSLVSFELR